MNRLSTSKLALFSWALYDFGNSAFSAVIQTFIFAAYFTQQIAVNEVTGSTQWGLSNGFAAIMIAILAPILGAISDHTKKRKPWLAFFTLICVFTTALLWFATPSSANTTFALTCVIIGIVSAELSFVFYNAMLPEIVEENQVGQWSGWGWGIGYVGGTLCLILSLIILQTAPENSAAIRATFILVAVWYTIFSLPLFFLTPDTTETGIKISKAVLKGVKQLKNTLLQIHQYKNLALFLIARIFYIDGLTTLFAFGGIYAATTFEMNAQEIALFGICMNISAGIGAIIFAQADDIIGSKRLIILSLCGIIFPITALIFTSSQTLFWTLGLALGTFIGPIQSASRSYMARAAPPHLRNEMFGFFAFSGKATSFLGPILVGFVISLTQSQRAGMGIILALFLLGLLFMVPIKEHPES